MTTRRWLCAVCAAAGLMAPAAWAGPGPLRSLEDAAESTTLDIFLTSATEGRVNARLCDYCELLTLRVDASTAVFLRGGARATLQVAEERRAQGATVIFDRESRLVKRILLW